MEQEASVCVRCRTWKEDLYWKHFSSMHFFLFLPKDFHQHLVLPAKFGDNMMRKLPDKVSLIDPSAFVWEVELNKTDTIEFGGDGWIQFAKAHNLEEKNLLVFKYKKNLSFEVLIFDLKSFCEKESSYFVKRFMYENKKKRTITEALSMEVVEDEDNDDDHHNDSDFVVSKKSKKRVAEEPKKTKSPCPTKKSNARVPQGRTGPRKTLRASQAKSKSKALSEKEAEVNGAEDGAAENEALHEAVEKEPRKNGAAKKPSHVPGTTKEKEPDKNGLAVEEETEGNGTAKEAVDVSEIEQNTEEDRRNVLETPHSKKSNEKTGIPKKRVRRIASRKLVSPIEKGSSDKKSNRREVTRKEKEMAVKMALGGMTENSFMAVMRPSAVYRGFYLNVNTGWMNKHLQPRSQPVVLRMGEETWEASFYYYNGKKGGGLSGYGWRKFVVDNNLEEFDVCIITLASDKDELPAIMDVQIFRVVPEIVPPSLVSGSKLV